MQGQPDSICIIPARGGSKRIPHKNLLKIGDSYAMGLSIRSIIEAGVCSRIVVTTDSEEIAEVAISHGAEVPFLRTSNLADDFTTTTEVIRDSINRLGLLPRSAVLCSYPLALLEPARVKEFFESAPEDSFHVTIGKLRVPPDRILGRNSSGAFEMSNPAALNKRTQDLPGGYFDAGKMYLASAGLWMTQENMLTGAFSGFILNESEAIDVDTPDDWSTLLRHRGI